MRELIELRENACERDLSERASERERERDLQPIATESYERERE